MRVEGTRTFSAPRDTVWEVLNSPERMAKLMPGVESFDVKDDTHWRANVKIPLGLGGMRMTFDFTKLEERQPEFAKLHAKGNGVGAIVSMDTAFDLAEAQGGGTDMKWQADVKIAGPDAEGPANPEGTSGAEDGISPLAPEAYDEDADGPTQSTES